MAREGGKMNALDREMEILEDELAAGDLTREEFNRQVRELESEYRAEAHEAAAHAYEEELERW